MILVLWRGILISLCCIAVSICYPYYTDNALSIMYTWAAIAFIVTALLTWLSKMILLGRSHIFNTIFDMVLIIVFLYVLLNIFPQLDGQSPYERLKKGKYPTWQEIDVGLSNYGLVTRQGAIKDFKDGIDEISNNMQEVKTMILKEHKD